ncbi:MAG: hypothetical protein O3C45_03585 [Bacteroidetes bacterium]|nr:hypothetical protein [Bacteroidota bacterium]MDA0874123.1 hypothetical protein [Bacteroidota bacterium]
MRAQEHLSFRGEIYSDYNYLIASPVDGEAGENGFGFRRARFTTDFTLSDRFDGRIRFQSTDDDTTSKGKPSIYIMDLFLRWKNVFGEGHQLTFGMFRPPIWWAAEAQWGYRSLEQTIQDRVGMASPRDIGIGLTGPINRSGSLKYAATFANNSEGKQETDKFKRFYGQLTWAPSEAIDLTAGSDYYRFDGGSTLAWNAYAGFDLEHARFGVEGFLSRRSFEAADLADTYRGVSLFANADISDKHRGVLRFDRVNRDDRGVKGHENWAIGGIAFVLDDRLQVVPNMVYVKRDLDEEASIMARLTVWATF